MASDRLLVSINPNLWLAHSLAGRVWRPNGTVEVGYDIQGFILKALGATDEELGLGPFPHVSSQLTARQVMKRHAHLEAKWLKTFPAQKGRLSFLKLKDLNDNDDMSPEFRGEHIIRVLDSMRELKYDFTAYGRGGVGPITRYERSSLHHESNATRNLRYG